MALSPTSSRGSGTFNGGTITQALRVNLDDGQAAPAGRFSSADDQVANSFVVDEPFGGNTLTVGAFGGVTVVEQYGALPALAVKAHAASTGGALSVTDDAVVPVQLLLLDAQGSLLQLPVGGLLIGKHSAPADGDVASGTCALWFDQTNGVGATKLMVKAKSADGTVKTAAIVLA